MALKNRSRAAFTLVELLVVLAIISVLAALTSAAIHRSRVTQMVRTSEDVVVKLQEAIETHIKTINEQIVADRRSRTPEFQAMVTFCDNDEDRAAALLTYCRVRRAFPVTGADAASPGFNVGGVNFLKPKPFLSPTSLVPINGANADHVSAALLYVAISKQAGKGNAFDSDAATSGAQADITLNGVSCRIFKDSWGVPIGYRLVSSPALPELSQAPYTKTAAETDPFDPLGKLATWTNVANRNAAQTALGVTFDGRNKMFIVYTAGKNSTYEALGGDDILGHRLRSIGQRGSK